MNSLRKEPPSSKTLQLCLTNVQDIMTYQKMSQEVKNTIAIIYGSLRSSKEDVSQPVFKSKEGQEVWRASIIWEAFIGNSTTIGQVLVGQL